MDINDRNIKMWSTIGARATFGLAALDLAKEIDNLINLTSLYSQFHQLKSMHSMVLMFQVHQ